MTTTPHGSYRKWVRSSENKQQTTNKERVPFLALIFAFVIITGVASLSLYGLLAMTLNIAGERDLLTNRQLYGVALGLCVVRGFDHMMYNRDKK